jgi:hypothetical protein
MKKTPLDDVLYPVMPALDDDGLKLYSDMISDERSCMSALIQSDIKIFFLPAHDIEPLEITAEEDFDGIKKRGRTLVVVKPGFDYTSWLNQLKSPREAFSSYLQEKVDEQNLLNYKDQKPQTGIRTTALPVLIDFNAEIVTYSYNAAYKASTATKKEILELFSIKEEKLKKSLENSTKKHQHTRSDDYTRRLKDLKVQEQRFKELSKDIEIIARVSSGHGLSLRATNKTEKSAINFKIKNISIIFSDKPENFVLKKANFHDRPSIYGACILEIPELNLKIHKK